MKRFVPIEGKSRVQVEDSGTGISLSCLDGNSVDIAISGFGMYKTFVKNIPLTTFTSNLNALRRDLKNKNTETQYRLIEWIDGEGITINRRDFMIRLTTSESRLLSFLSYAEEFLQEVKEHIHEMHTH